MVDGEGTKQTSRLRFSEERATAPTPLEDSSDAAWQEFLQLQSGAVSIRAYTETEADKLAAQPDERQQPAPAPSVLGTLMLARRANRSCPKLARWGELYAMLSPFGGVTPPPPPALEEWKKVSSMAKRLVLRDQIEWAAKTGVLPVVFAFLEALPETDWEYFG